MSAIKDNKFQPWIVAPNSFLSRRKIPTGRDALGRLLYLIVKDKKFKNDASLTVAGEILDIWLSIRKDSNLHNKNYVSRKLKTLHTAYTKVKANINRKNDKESKRKVDFIKRIDSNFVVCKTKSVLPAAIYILFFVLFKDLFLK